MYQRLQQSYDRFAGLAGTVKQFYWLMALTSILLVWVGVSYQSRIHLNHDVGWIVHSAGWLLEGRRFGSDIVDPSPPLAWYLSLPAAAAYRLGLSDEVTAIRTSFWLINIGVLIASFCALMPLVRSRRFSEAAALGLAAGIAICLLPAGSFGQRDVVAFALSLPYMLMTAIRISRGNSWSTVASISAGMLAGAGFCLKPYLLVVPVLVESCRSALTLDVKIWLRPEAIGIAIAVAVYLGVLLLLTPDYINFALPMIEASYWAYEGNDHLVTNRLLEALTPAVLALAIALATRSANAFHAILASGVTGASISYWIQHKGFAYHAYPVVAMSFLLLAYSLAVAVKATFRQLREINLGLFLVVGVALLYLAFGSLNPPIDRAMAWYREYDRLTGERGRSYEELLVRLRQLGVGSDTYLFALSTHPKPGFPATNYLGAKWAGQAATQFVIPAYARRGEIEDAGTMRQVLDAADYQRKVVAEAIAMHRPAIVLVDAQSNRLGLVYRRFDDIAFYQENREFRRIWACYGELERIGAIRIFQLLDPACMPAVSAGNNGWK